MAQDGTTAGGASYQIDNVTFPVGRTKLQSIFDAIRSTNIGNTAPDLVAGQFWIDNNTPSTTVWTLYFYDGTDSIQFATIDTINNTVNFIAGTATVSGDLTVDTNTLYVDSTNNLVGIGTSSPETNSRLSIRHTDQNNLVAIGNNLEGLATGTNNGGAIYFGVGTDTNEDPTGAIEASWGGATNPQIHFGLTRGSNAAQKAHISAHYGGTLRFNTAGSERMRIDGSGDVGIGTSNPNEKLDVVGNIRATDGRILPDGAIADGDATTPHYSFYLDQNIGMFRATADTLGFSTNATEAMRIDSSGNVLVGTTDNALANNSTDSSADNGISLRGSIGKIEVARYNSYPFEANRTGSDGDIISFRKSGALVGSIGTEGSQIYIVTGDTGLKFAAGVDAVVPVNTGGTNRDDAIDLGVSSVRFDDIYATNGTIQTSDQNEKQSIQSLTAIEIAVAQRISKLFKTFKWNSAVEQKGDNARTHTGVIAQEVQQAFADEGLDVGNYALFISSTWWEKEISVDAVAEELDEEGNIVVEGKDAYTYIDTKEEATEGYTERTRLGIRYPELLSFVSSAFEQRLTNIETRLTALET